MTREEQDFIGSMNMCDEISNEAYKKIMCHCEEQEQKTGHWIIVDKNKLRCSECEVIHLIAQYPSGKIDWCPNCGARMVKSQEGEKDVCKDCYYNDGEVHAECVICDRAESEG